MDFSVSEEQAMLADSVARFIDNDYDFETRRKIMESDARFSPEMWRTFAELGWTAVPFDEEDGGLGGGPVELMLMMEQFGRGLVLEPYLATVVLAGGVLRRCASPAQKERWLAPLIAGELQAALAFAEPQARFDIADIATTATADGDHYLLNGRKTFVLNGGDADLLIIPSRFPRDIHHLRTSGGIHDHPADEQAGSSRDIHRSSLAPVRADTQDIALLVVSADAQGVERKCYPTVDGHGAAEITLRNVRTESDAVLALPGKGFAGLRDTIDEATLAVSAEAVGILRALHDKTVEYSKSRVQFGVPIGSFQALQHRMVDTLILCEQCRSLMLWTTMLAASASTDAAQAVSALKYQIGSSGRLVAQEAVQIHGGMGVTWELDIAHFFKRFSAIEMLFGNADFHLDRYLALSDHS